MELFLIVHYLNYTKITNLEGKWAFIISDAIGLVSFSITGSIIAIESDLILSVLVLAFITAVGGGTIRDVLLIEFLF